MADFLLSVGVDVGLSYTEMQKDISKLVSQLNSNPPKIKVAFDIDDKMISNLRNQIAEISKALGTTGAVKAGSGASSTAAVNTQVRERINLETQAAQAAAQAAAAKKLADDQAMKGELSRQALLKKSYTLLTQMQNAENKWTAAKTGKSSSAYTAIQSDIASLQQWNMEFKSGKLTADEFSAKLSSLSLSFTTNSNTIKAAGEATQTWGQRLGGLSAKFGTWFSITRVIMAAYRAVRQMVSAVIDLDTAMTELKKVTDETDATYNKFLDDAAARAKKLGAALSDVVTASADFARLGYNIEEAEQLADAAIVYKNVGDGITDISDASESIIATMQAFGVEAKDVMSIVDKFNEVGNKYAISSKGVGDSLLRSAAAMHSANNTLDETIALAAAANTIVQDPEKVGTVLKTVSMYLRAAKTEAEDAGESTDGMANSVSELRGEILELTGNKVDIQIDENTFKSTYQILKELSGVWDTLSDVTQANILEMVGGKRNSNVVAAILENFSIAAEAAETSAKSTGSALEENDKYLESINGKISIFKANFEEFSNTFIQSDFVKGIVDIGTWLMQVLTGVAKVIDALGGLNNALFVVAGVIATIKADALVTLIGTTLPNKIIGLGNTIKTLGTTFMTAFRTAKASGTSSLQSISAGFKSVTASASAAQIAVAAFVAIIAVINMVSHAIEEARQKAISEAEAERESASAIVEKGNALNSAYLEYLQYSQLAERTPSQEEAFQNSLKTVTEAIEGKTNALKGLTAGTKDYTEALSGQVEKELEAAKLAAIQERDAAEKALEKMSYSDWDGSKIAVYYGGTHKENTDEQALVESILDKYKTTETYALGHGVSSSDYYIDAGGQEADNIVDFYYKLLQLKDELTRQNMMEGESYDNVTSTINTLKASVEAYVKAKYDEVAATYKTDKGIPKTLEEYEAYKKHISDNLSNSFGLDDTTINSIVEGYLKTEGLYEAIKKVDKGATEATTKVKTFAEAVSDVQSLTNGLEKLDKIYADIYDKGDFDWGSVLNNKDFAETFGNLGEDYTNFIKTISNSPTDIKACQNAFNNLATAYIENSNILQDVTDETRNATVAMLEQMGVANAAALVDEQLAINKEKLRLQTKLGTDAEYADILALYDEETASRITAQAIYELAIAKIQTNENALLTSSDIAQLEALAEAAGATAESLLNVAKAKSYIAQAETLEKQKADLIAKGADPRGISTVSTQADNYRLWAEELLNKKITYEVDFKRASYTGGSSTKSAKSSAAKSAEKETETWFERQLKDHQHLVAMEQETEAEYLAWLNKAYKQAYKEGIIELDDYYKYQEEIYEGLRDLFMDSLGDVEHEISMRENYEGEEKKIISLYKGLMSDVEKEIAKARAQGLTDEDDYIQELQEKWQDYANAIKDIREEIKEAAKDALDEMIDYRVDMLKQEIEDEKDALDKKLDNLKEFYDKQKEMLQDKYDEEKYLEDQAEKRKSVSDIKGELAMLENDDSAWAQKRRLELTQELTDAEKDLADFEKENALDKALDAIDEAYNSQEAQLQREMDALDEKLNDPNALFNQALEDIKNNSKNQLYYQMLMYNRQYGDGNDETVKKLWEDAYGALNNYEKLFGKLYKGVDLKNETGVKNEKGWDDEKVSGTKPKKKPKNQSKPKNDNKNTAPPLSSGSKVTIKKTATHFGSKSNGVKMASFVPGGSYTVYQTSGNQVLIGRNGVYTGWVKKSDIVGYASGTKHATAGLHELYERGAETLFVSGDGSKYRILNDEDKVLNAKATNFLYDFANSGGGILEQMLKNVFGGTGLNGIAPTVISNEINMGDIIVQGSANERTVSEIRRAQRESVDFMLKEFTKLNK